MLAARLVDAGQDGREQLVGFRVQPLAQRAVAFDEGFVDIVTADQANRHDGVSAFDGDPGETAAALPFQLILLALELGHFAATARENQHGFVVPHQFSRGVGMADDAAVGRDEVSAETGELAQRPLGERANTNAEFAPSVVRHEQYLGEAEGRVVAHQQKSAVAGQAVQPGDVRPVQIDQRVDGIARGAQHVPQRTHAG